MAYVPDPTDPTQPSLSQPAGDMAYELQALKGYIQSLVSGGSNFYYSGSFRNRLKNGAFRISQRGAGPLTCPAGVGTYTLDNWGVLSNGYITLVNQVASSIAGVGASISCMQLLPQSASVANLTAYSRLEAVDSRDFVAGTTITVSGWFLTSNANLGGPSIGLSTPTAGDNNYTSGATNVATTIPATVIIPFLNNNWTFFKATLPLTADAIKGLQLSILLPTAGTPSFYLANIQLEKGSAYTPFEQRSIQLDLALCQRNYQAGSIQLNCYSTAGLSVAASLMLPITMFTSPIVTSSTGSSANVNTLVTTATTTSLLFSGLATATGNVILVNNFILYAEL